MEIKLLLSLSKEQRKKVKGLLSNKTSVLFKEGAQCTQIGIVVSGEVEIVSTTPSGRSIVYNTLKSGDVFGNNLIFSSDNTYKGDVVLMGKTTLAIIEKADLVKFLQENKNFLMEYLKVSSDFAKHLNGQIKILSSDNCGDRVLNYLTIEGGSAEIKSISQLADQIHVTREALSRCLSKMVEKNVLIKEDKKYTINEQ